LPELLLTMLAVVYHYNEQPNKIILTTTAVLLLTPIHNIYDFQFNSLENIVIIITVIQALPEHKFYCSLCSTLSEEPFSIVSMAFSAAKDTMSRADWDMALTLASNDAS
jgi:hypothetical protein